MESKDLPREKVLLIDNELSEMQKFTKGECLRRCLRNTIYIAALILVVFSIFLMANVKKVSYDAGASVTDDPNFMTHPTEQTVTERIAELQGQVSLKSVYFTSSSMKMEMVSLMAKKPQNSMRYILISDRDIFRTICAIL